MTRNELILKAAVDAGKAIAAIKPNSTTQIHKAGRQNYVTLADKTSEQIIFTLIRENFPDDSVLSEETASDQTEEDFRNTEHLWIIDPIDGTVNYQHQMNYSCVSIGYAEKGILKLAAVYDPFREQLYSAEQDKGAFHNGKKIQVSVTEDLHRSIVITDNSYDPEIFRKHLETLLKIPETPWVLMKGSAALELCEVASGQADLFYSYCLNPWDIAAGMLIIAESGGKIVDRNGQQANFFSKTIVAGNEKVIDEFLFLTENTHYSTV